MSDPIIELDHLVREYGETVKTRAVDDVDLRIDAGEFTALVGPSGSGKSTLLNLMGLLDRPTSGEVTIEGRPTSSLDDDAITALRAHTLGFIFQFHHLLTGFSALENVMMPAAVDVGSFDDAMRRRAHRLLNEVGLADHIDKDIRHLSGGQQQRVAVARALTNEPQIVLADEPTGNLDTATSDQVMDLLRGINADLNTAFLIVTHDDHLAESCARYLRLVDGKLVDDRPGRKSSR